MTAAAPARTTPGANSTPSPVPLSRLGSENEQPANGSAEPQEKTPAALPLPTPDTTDRAPFDAQERYVGVSGGGDETRSGSNTDRRRHETRTRDVGFDPEPYLHLRTWAMMHEDAAKALLAAQGRVRAANVDPAIYAAQIAHLALAEHELRLARRRAYRRLVRAHLPGVAAWQAETLGIGEDALARLLGFLGHPRIAQPHRWDGTGTNRVLVALPTYERSVAKLWAYCGYGDAARKRRVGMTETEAAALGNPRCKVAAYILAESCMKVARSPYRAVYDDGRARYETRDDWRPARQHAAALRLVAKHILRDLWIAATPDGDLP